MSLIKETDSFLIYHLASAFQCGKITKAEWDKVNTRRKYLKVLKISDIASGSGQHIDYNMLIGNLDKQG